MEHTSRPDDSWIIAVGKYNPLGMTTELGVNGLEKRHLLRRLGKIASQNKDVLAFLQSYKMSAPHFALFVTCF